jgi:DNA polymerase/3'-5' exonuclease PolX
VTTDTDESADIESIDGIGPKTAESLRDAGIETVGDLRSTERSDLYDIDGIGAATASELLSVVDSASEDEEEMTDQTGDDTTDDQSAGEEEASDASDDTSSKSESVGLIEVRNKTIDLAPDLTGRDLDGVIEVAKRGDDWVAVVEMIERKSVPDTQDILGRYEIEFADDGTVTSYRRVNRYRRTESNPDEF